MPINEEFRSEILNLARTCYTPGDEDPLSHGLVVDEDRGHCVFAFTPDVDPGQRTEVIRQHCEPYTAKAAAHAFESYGISAEDKTPANLLRYGARYAEWPEHLRMEALSVIIESRDGGAEFWQAKITQNDDGEFELGEFEKQEASTKGRMVGFFPEVPDISEVN